jgi:hypothetical protein
MRATNNTVKLSVISRYRRDQAFIGISEDGEPSSIADPIYVYYGLDVIEMTTILKDTLIMHVSDDVSD